MRGLDCFKIFFCDFLVVLYLLKKYFVVKCLGKNESNLLKLYYM